MNAVRIETVNGRTLRVVKHKVAHYHETPTVGGWERVHHNVIRLPMDRVAVARTESKYREVCDGYGSRYRVTYRVTGERAADYVRECLPTARVIETAPGCVLAEWFF